MKLQVFILITLAISLQAQVPSPTDCNPGCLTCYPKDVQGCYTCWKRLVVPKKSQLDIPNQAPVYDCGDLAPVTENCRIYVFDPTRGGSFCSICEQGYFLEATTLVCKPLTIPDCTTGYQTSGIGFCVTCDGGYPSFTSFSCNKWSQPIQGAAKNCKWGTRNYQGLVSCAVCNSGYSFTPDGYCVENTGDLTGCMSVDSTKSQCLACNAIDGYYMNSKKGGCKKM